MSAKRNALAPAPSPPLANNPLNPSSMKLDDVDASKIKFRTDKLFYMGPDSVKMPAIPLKYGHDGGEYNLCFKLGTINEPVRLPFGISHGFVEDASGTMTKEEKEAAAADKDKQVVIDLPSKDVEKLYKIEKAVKQAAYDNREVWFKDCAQKIALIKKKKSPEEMEDYFKPIVKAPKDPSKGYVHSISVTVGQKIPPVFTKTHYNAKREPMSSKAQGKPGDEYLFNVPFDTSMDADGKPVDRIERGDYAVVMIEAKPYVWVQKASANFGVSFRAKEIMLAVGLRAPISTMTHDDVVFGAADDEPELPLGLPPHGYDAGECKSEAPLGLPPHGYDAGEGGDAAA